MVTVALAGATTGFGLTVLKTFLHLNPSLKPDQQHNFILLSRSPQPEWNTKGLEVRQVSYENHSQLVSALKGVHTLISLIGGDVSALRNAQASLLAAARAADVKRFAPSEYAGMGYEGIDLYAFSKAEVWTQCLAAKQETGMEVARFNCGLFMSILATGTSKGITERVQSRKFLVRENSIEEMEDLAQEEGKRFYNQVRVALVKGYCDVPDDLNRMFPEIQPIDCESFVKKWWSGVRLPEAAWEKDQAFM
ncbi:hypothetical protein KC318_g8080 [Hortaea werneckii]|nr:hypothetical protein KC334_g6637 [Hortaea werneckii]KAI7009986.1 hypothetical protein KC355_g6359 [Hortaea werneckii]KAI7663852.1 hypothetical protein KC318_g8080 [Hortaea werneckii]